MEKKFFICKHCKNLIGMIEDSGVPIICCGEPMSELIANTEEASYEKHIPEVALKDDKVAVIVGEVIHPMLPEHHINWIFLETEMGGQRKVCKDTPTAVFSLAGGDKPVAVYAYCNLHGLWKREIK